MLDNSQNNKYLIKKSYLYHILCILYFEYHNIPNNWRDNHNKLNQLGKFLQDIRLNIKCLDRKNKQENIHRIKNYPIHDIDYNKHDIIRRFNKLYLKRKIFFF